MTKTVWITRTEPSAQISARAWEAKGYDAVVAPLLRVVNAPEAPAAPSSNSVLVFTSKNAVFAYQGYGFNAAHKVITVGDATAAAARAAGFTDVTSAQGTSADVTALILRAIPKTTPVIHCAGRHIRGSISEDLRAAGFAARRDLYYQSEALAAWPAIDFSRVTLIAFYSPLAARSFWTLYRESLKDKVSLDIHMVTFISISLATDAALGDLPSAQRLIAEAPNEAAMLAKLDLTAP